MGLIFVKILSILTFSTGVFFCYRREYKRGYIDGIASTKTATTLPHDYVSVVLELPPHLHSKLIAHLTQYERTDYISDEFNFIINKNDVKIFADFAYSHSLGISVKKENS